MSETPEQPLPPPPSPVAPPPPSDNGLPSSEQRQWAMFAHLSALLGVLIPIPGGNMLGPLIIWLVQKEKMAFVDDQAKEALNFQITVFGAVLVSMLAMLILIGFLLLVVVGLGALVFTIIAAIKANEGVAYRYPLTIRLIK